VTSPHAPSFAGWSAAVLAAWPLLDDGAGPQPAVTLPLQPLSGGLINDTYTLGKHYILQRLHPIFAPPVNDDIAALVPQLLAAGVPVPTLVRTASGASHTVVTASDPTAAGCWRLLGRLAGTTLHKLPDVAHARSAAELVGRFHQALLPVHHIFAFTRPGAHNTPLHMQKLQLALQQYPDHRLYRELLPLAAEILQRWQDFGPVPELPVRIIHGDLKVSNLLFSGDKACAILDLDTMAHSSYDIELGDALRSWCNTGAEDDPQPAFATEVFVAATSAWLGVMGPDITAAERQSLARGTLRITLELSARFALDTLVESYFGWNRERYESAGSHNLVRARNQLGLARDIAQHLSHLQALLQ